MTRYTSLGIRNNEHPVLHSEDKTSPETGIRKRDGNAYPARYNERRNRKNEKGSKHRLCACNFRQVGQESRFIIFIDDMFGLELPESDEYMTVGGLILHEYQSFPKLNEVIKFDNFEFKIIKSTSRKIELVKLHIIK